MKENSILKKITILFVFFILIPLSLIMSYVFYKYANTQVNQSQIIQVKNIKANIVVKQEVIQSFSEQFANNSHIRAFLSSDFEMDFKDIEDYKQCYKLLNSQFYNIYLNNIKVIMHQEAIPQGYHYFYSYDRVRNKEWYEQFIQGNNQNMWVYIEKEDSFLHNRLDGVIFMQKIYDYNKNIIGSVCVYLTLEELLDNTHEGVSDDEVILITEKFSNTHINDQKFYVIDNLEPLPLSIGLKKINLMTNNIYIKTQLWMGILIVFTAICILVFYLFMKRILSRIKRYIIDMEQSIEHNFTYRLSVTRKDELGYIASLFNMLLDKIQQLVKETVNKEVLHKETQLKALQLQINPHFLYNTLEVFSSNMVLIGEIGLADGISNLGQILRYSIKSDKVVLVEMECMQLRRYMYIQQLRYNNINYSINNELPKDYKILKLILQPLVENSIIHGLNSNEQDFKIDISLYIKGKRVFIEVHDEGKGMKPECVANLRTVLENNEEYESESIGLMNIHRRIQLFYGKEYGLIIDSKENKYTNVIIQLPLDTKKIDREDE